MAIIAPGQPRPERVRLFVAIEVPPPVQAAVDEALAPWRDRLPGARWVRPSSRHVTLAFLGSVAPARVDRIRERLMDLAGTTAPPEDVMTTTLGSFPGRGKARVLWAGLADPGGGLAALAASVRMGLSPFAASADDAGRPFRAHLTLARFGPPRRLPDGLAGTPVGPAEVPVTRMVLYRSEPGGPGGPRYTPEDVFPLVGAVPGEAGR